MSGAKVTAVVDTLRWRIVFQETDLSPTVPFNPSPPLLLSLALLP